VRFATRLFRRQPGLVAVTVGGVALAVAVSTAVFSIVNALAYRGYGIADERNVFRVQINRNTGPAPWTYSSFSALRTTATTMDVAAVNWGYTGYGSFTATAPAGDERGRPIGCVKVSGNYHQVLGARAIIGRPLRDEDDAPGATSVVVLAEAVWRNSFDSDPSTVGRTIWIDGQAAVVVGVIASGFTGPIETGGTFPGAWMTMTAAIEAARVREAARAQAAIIRRDAIIAARPASAADRDRLAILEVNARSAAQSLEFANVVVLGRLRPGVSRERAAAEVSALWDQLNAARSADVPMPRIELARIGAVRDAKVLGVSRTPLLAAIALLVLLACANVANLML
jgi:hypothetical protein